MNTPITDRVEAEIEAAGKRDVPVRVYQLMRVLEDERNELAKALEPFANLRGWQAPKGHSSTVFADKIREAKKVLESLSR